MIPDFNYINGEYILKEIYELKDMNEVLKWCSVNVHLENTTLQRILNYGLIYYINEVSYLKDEIIGLLIKYKNKFNIDLNENEIREKIEKYVKDYKKTELDKDNIEFI
jgi:hypothetical protein